MKRTILTFSFIFMLGSFIPQKNLLADTPSLSPEVEILINQIEQQVIEWRHHFHQYPELSNREFETAKTIAAHLKDLGLEIRTGIAHTGVVGILKGGKPGPVIGLRADIDALPVKERVDLPFASKARGEYNGQEVDIMHACGHDTHIAIMMGVAQVLSSIRDELPGTVKFVFQPAEEGAPEGEEGGAELMIKEGVMLNPDIAAMFALHIDASREVGHIGYRSGGIMASVDDFRITVTGRQSHGAYPWMSVDPIVTAAQIINSLQTVVSRTVPLTEGAAVVTVGTINAGVRSNIIPEEAVMTGTIRSLVPANRPLIHEQIRQIATNIAEGMGATVEIKIPMSTSYPVTYNDPDLTAKMLPVLENVAGKSKVALAGAETGAEDFAFFANEVPSFYFFVGGRPSNVAPEDAADHHTPDFYIDDSGLTLGVRAMTAVALAYLQGE